MPGTEKRGERWRTKPYYQGSYKRRARAVRVAAYSDPHTKCWRCGLTLAEAQRIKPSEAWDAGHVVDSEVGGVLLPEHASCNRAAGARMVNRASNSQRRGGYRW